jgi:predicted Zn-dependent protease
MVRMRSVFLVVLSLTLAAQDKEAVLGRQLAAEMTRSTTTVDSQPVRAYVSRLAAKVQAGLHTAVVAKLHDPIALPGGYVFIPVSLLLAANSEAEFAGMLAQTIARGTISIGNYMSVPIIFVGGNDGLIPLAIIGKMRAKALQADADAVRMMSSAGFDPAALLRYIQRTQPPDEPHSPLPPRATRIAALEEAIRDLPPAFYSESGDEFYRIQALARPAPSNRPPPSLLR